jgi:peptidyl-prolyl cis-trans isomerase A (cyclophilin A)
MSVILALMLAAMPACAEVPPGASAAEELRLLLEGFLDGASRNDAAVHERFWADDLVYTSSAGVRTNKAEILESMRSDPAPTEAESAEYSAEDIRIRQYGDTAVVAFRLAAATGSGAEYFFNTGTFVKRDGEWRAVAWQATRIPPADPGADATPAGETVNVILETALGEIEVETYLSRAPASAASFLQFADLGDHGGAAFYRVVTPANDNGSPVISVLQGGLVDENIVLSPVEHETTRDTGIRHTDGVISLARGDPGTGSGAAFFICIGDQPALDFGAMRNPDGLGFAAFGKVVRGMDVVRKIHGLETKGASESAYTDGQMLTAPVKILSARRVAR